MTAALAADAAPHAGRIGPNAIIRIAEAAEVALGAERTASLLRRAGLGQYLTAPPEGMVDEREVTRLHRVLRAEIGVREARALARDAGARTADYLLAHRIPRPVQVLLRVLPAHLASRILLDAIRRHAWTFAGSGRFTARPGRPTRFAIAGCPICAEAVAEPQHGPLCDYYAGTFERLFDVLVHANVQVSEVACQALGAPDCEFEIRW